MERQPHVGLLGFGDDRLEEMLRAFELLGARMRTDALFRRQVLRQRVVVGGVAGAGASELLLVALHQPVRVEVVFDDRQTCPAGCSNRADHVGDLRVGAGPAPDHLVEARDHQVAERDAAGFVGVDARPHVGFGPRDARPAGEHVVDADLLQAPHPRFVRVRVAKADLWRVAPLRRHARERGLGSGFCRGVRRQRRWHAVAPRACNTSRRRIPSGIAPSCWSASGAPGARRQHPASSALFDRPGRGGRRLGGCSGQGRREGRAPPTSPPGPLRPGEQRVIAAPRGALRARSPTRTGTSRRAAPGASRRLRGDPAEVGRAEHAVRVAEVHVVEDVEDLGAHLHARRAARLDRLAKREIGLHRTSARAGCCARRCRR